jgi:Xaa-Pro aminopeptidase
VDEAERKRRAALAAVGPFATDDAADVRWLLCGRGRPVAAGSSPYTVVVDEERAQVLYQDIEASRVAAEERWEELGYEPVAHPWFEPPPVEPTQPDLSPLRVALGLEEAERYRAAGGAAASAFAEALGALRPELTGLRAAGELAGRLHAAGFTTPVVLVGGEVRALVHRHPLPTAEPLGRFALLAVTAEREGLHVSLTRVVSFGSPPGELERVVRAAAEVDAAVLAASRPGESLGALFDVLARAYEEQGFPEEWRRHHQGGLTGYRGREVFAVPGEPTVLPDACAVAWNPSVTGGGKSEDTALVGAGGVEILTRTPDLGELATAAGVPRPAIVRL